MIKGTVIKSTGSWYTVLDETGKYVECRIPGSFRMKGIKSTNPVAVGDYINFKLEPGEETGIIAEIKERKNYIIRKSTNLSKRTHIIAANIDQAILIATIAQPRTSTGFIDRFAVTAEAYNIPLIIVFNKLDLYADVELDLLAELKNAYEKIGYTTLSISVFKEEDIEMISNLLKDKTSLIAGHSGVGKSTLINAIEPDLKLKTGIISGAHHKGKHTTTFAEMFPVKSGGFIIDTPGIKEFGLTAIKKEELAHYFPEMRALMNECRFDNCLHVNEPGCAVKKAVENSEIAEFRYENYLNMLESEEPIDYRG